MTASKPTRFPQSATDPMKQMEGAVAAQKENIETVVRAGTSAAARGVEKAVARTKEQMEAATTAGGICASYYLRPSGGPRPGSSAAGSRPGSNDRRRAGFRGI